MSSHMLKVATELPVSLLVPIFSVAILICYRYVLYPLFLSPLRKIPAAHPLAAVSSLWINWQRYRRVENNAIDSAHQRLGPYVRLGPNEISVNCVDGGIKTIYAGGFDKDVWYTNSFTNFDVLNMFSTALSRPHSGRKRMISNIYSKSALQSSETMQAVSANIVYTRLLPLLDESATSCSRIDIVFLMYCTAMDLVTGYQFGISSSSRFLLDEKEARHWLHLYHCRRSYTFWPSEHPRFTSFCKHLGIHLAPSFVADANRELENWCLKLVDSAENVVSENLSDTKTGQGNVPVVYKQLRNSLLAEQKKPSPFALASSDVPLRLQTASELMDHLAAGHETSAITLAYMFHELAKRPSLQQALRKELLTLEPRVDTRSQGELPDPKAIDSLPLLHAVVMETLRRHQAIPGPQPRTTPANAVIGPYIGIPAGVRISAQAMSLHRNEKVYPRAKEWIPERWLPQKEGVYVLDEGQCSDMRPSEEHLKEMHRWFWAFSSGGRMCIGSNMAMQQMKLIAAAVVTGFYIEIVDDEGIEQEDAYTAQPKSGKLMIKLTRWE